MKITMAHGSGGRPTAELIDNIFAKAFDNEVLSAMEDSAVVEGAEKIALTTDSFVVDPVFFPGGDIGRLSICGTVNDLLMRGAVPKYITCGFILEEGADTDDIVKITGSMAETAAEAGVTIVAGDTKVINGSGGIYINTSGTGFMEGRNEISARNILPGDRVIISGNLGEHHAAILGSRMSVKNNIKSDVAPLNDMVMNLIKAGIHVHALRDITRGGLATVLKELSEASEVDIQIHENLIPVSSEVRDFCGLLGLDPVYMGNEGKMVAFVPEDEASEALDIIKNSRYGSGAVLAGEVTGKSQGHLVMETSIGGKRELQVLQGQGLPRIC